ncbi:LysR family transcriptional regulator [Ktedonobacter sp. SOSP1-52]|uniref:LysR family transcriptional regulator n=1 Tax=Ktedonobacter sp. SOSP1-52 TaxID=2778366 RepID=UPI001915978D|nr:LysR family transcriptional regulator [Ktedonobacter sp. SOSP1-52]GHO68129.1 LysR family transcriptional regulator [Ktedonobacter sp. SOSP1-52]
MELLQLKYFLTVARLEHMTRAADELGIAQPPLSQTIARLEEELGVPLFDRLGRNIHLNHFGRAYVQRVERIFEELEQGKRDLGDLADGRQGQVGLAMDAATHLLPDLLSAFRKDHPGVHFLLSGHHNTVTSLVQQLARGTCDLCISSPPLQQPGITSISLLTEDIWLAFPSIHLLARRSQIRLQEAAQEAFISMKPGHSWRELTDSFCQQAGFRPRIVFESDDPSTIRGLIRAEQGIAFGAAISWRGTVDPAVIQIPISEPKCQRTIGLSWLTDRRLSMAAQQFRQFVIDYFARLSLV